MRTTISKWWIVALLLSVVPDGMCQDNFEALKNHLGKKGFEFSSANDISYFEKCGADEAIKFLKVAAMSAGLGFTETKKEVARAIGRNPYVAKFLTEKIASLPNLVENSQHRHSYFETLAQVDAPWAIDLAGRILKENEPFSTNRGTNIEFVKKISSGYVDNITLAAWTIGALGYEDYPGPAQLGQYDEVTVENCRRWWITNGPKTLAVVSEPDESVEAFEIEEAVSVNEDPAVSARSPYTVARILFGVLALLCSGGFVYWRFF